ncbi:hypothetical protein KCP75_22090 [Salmonella enterica subsp. enterica]|nr:hypothetical protein KCP75_22090 [Salmonella enterica subsp. enterica]
MPAAVRYAEGRHAPTNDEPMQCAEAANVSELLTQLNQLKLAWRWRSIRQTCHASSGGK